MIFNSEVREVGNIAIPTYHNTRIMMMPFHLHDVDGTLPEDLARWREAIGAIVALGPVHHGTAYLTIDEAAIARGETHRRPGLHVDGVGPRGDAGGWGGGGGYGSNGMLMTSTHVGCVAWDQTFEGWPGPDGDCAHLDPQIRDDRACVVLQPGVVYHCGPMTVHEALPMTEDCRRSFVRVSMPSLAPWYEGYTENPTGVRPAGPIHPRRATQMAYRP